MTRIYIAQYTDDDGETHIVSAHRDERAAVDALIDEFAPMWDEMTDHEGKRPADLAALNTIMDWNASIEATENPGRNGAVPRRRTVTRCLMRSEVGSHDHGEAEAPAAPR